MINNKITNNNSNSKLNINIDCNIVLIYKKLKKQNNLEHGKIPSLQVK